MTYPPIPPETPSNPYASPGPQPGALPSYGAASPQDAAPYGAPLYGAPPGQYPGHGGPGYPGVRGATDPDDMTLPLYKASFGAAVKRFFKGYVRFRGRASKSEYWWAQLFQVLISIVLVIVLLAVTMPQVMDLPRSEANRLSGDQAAMLEWMINTPSVAVVLGILVLYSLAILLPNLALGWRRLQDANVPGGWTFATLAFQVLSNLPIIGSLISMGALAWLIVIGTLSTKPEGQRFDRPV
ncbi:MAG: DUF805 domain-containing protein [Micrococcales bacterium]|nr:DUF805 domain-containing protein [Micrococcales bacterium]